VIALYRYFLSSQVRVGRIAVIALLAVAQIGIAWLVGRSDVDRPLSAAAEFVQNIDLALLVPFATLVFAAAAFGDLIDDSTLVYVWLHPVQRWRLVVSAWAAACTLALPLVVPAVAAGAALAGSSGLAGGAAGAAALGVAAYGAVFVCLGLVLRRALLWGTLFVLVWESGVGRFAAGAARLSVQNYTVSLFRGVSGFAEPRYGVEAWVAAVVLCGVAVALGGLASALLSRTSRA
jgi:ABC-2 type transport system permease protein